MPKKPEAKGNILVVLCMSVAILAVAFLAIHNLQTDLTQHVFRQRIKFNINQYRSNMVQLLQTPQSWEATYTAPENTPLNACLTDLNTPCPSGTYPLVIKDASGTPRLDPTAANNGFDLSASFGICNTYGTASPAGCVFQYLTTWQPDCPPSGPCVKPGIIISFTFNSNATWAVGDINPSNYFYSLRVN